MRGAAPISKCAGTVQRAEASQASAFRRPWQPAVYLVTRLSRQVGGRTPRLRHRRIGRACHQVKTEPGTEATASSSVAPAWTAELVAIYISKGHDYWGRQGEGRLQNGIESLDEVECVAGKGLAGDRYFGYRTDFKGQVTFFDEAVLEEVRTQFKLPRLPGSVFRRNLLVRGLQLGHWLGKRFVLQGIEFEGTQECKPCDWMSRVIADGAEDFMKGQFRGGLRARILTSGTLRVGRHHD